MSTQKKLMTNWRWWMVVLMFMATTVNYMDRQVLSLTWKDFIAPEFHWTDNDYGTITAIFSIIYAICMLFAGKFVDWMGTKKGYLWSIGVWSTGACLHAICGWLTCHIEGYESIQVMQAVESGTAAALAIASTSVWLFIAARAVLALGEAGNFPAAIKTTAEYFPKKDRAFATSIFNSGASVGALIAPATIPLLAQYFKDKGVGGGWEMAFVIIGAIGYVWMAFWVFMYNKPEKSKHVNAAELAYIHQDDAEDDAVQVGRDFFGCGVLFPEKEVDQVHHQKGIDQRSGQACQRQGERLTAFYLFRHLHQQLVNKKRNNSHQDTRDKADHQAERVAVHIPEGIERGKGERGDVGVKGRLQKAGQTENRTQKSAFFGAHQQTADDDRDMQNGGAGERERDIAQKRHCRHDNNNGGKKGQLDQFQCLCGWFAIHHTFLLLLLLMGCSAIYLCKSRQNRIFCR